MDLPSSEREGFDFAGWYNAAAANNAKLYDDEYFYGNADYVLYAGWNPKTYAANLDYNEKGEGAATVAAVTYTKDYYIAPPTVKESFNDKISSVGTLPPTVRAYNIPTNSVIRFVRGNTRRICRYSRCIKTRSNIPNTVRVTK